MNVPEILNTISTFTGNLYFLLSLRRTCRSLRNSVDAVLEHYQRLYRVKINEQGEIVVHHILPSMAIKVPSLIGASHFTVTLCTTECIKPIFKDGLDSRICSLQIVGGLGIGNAIAKIECQNLQRLRVIPDGILMIQLLERERLSLMELRNTELIRTLGGYNIEVDEHIGYPLHHYLRIDTLKIHGILPKIEKKHSIMLRRFLLDDMEIFDLGYKKNIDIVLTREGFLQFTVFHTERKGMTIFKMQRQGHIEYMYIDTEIICFANPMKGIPLEEVFWQHMPNIDFNFSFLVKRMVIYHDRILDFEDYQPVVIIYDHMGRRLRILHDMDEKVISINAEGKVEKTKGKGRC